MRDTERGCFTEDKPEAPGRVGLHVPKLGGCGTLKGLGSTPEHSLLPGHTSSGPVEDTSETCAGLSYLEAEPTDALSGHGRDLP